MCRKVKTLISIKVYSQLHLFQIEKSRDREIFITVKQLHRQCTFPHGNSIAENLFKITYQNKYIGSSENKMKH